MTGATPEARSGSVLRYLAKSLGAARRRRAPRWHEPELPVLGGDERLDWVVTFNEQLRDWTEQVWGFALPEVATEVADDRLPMLSRKLDMTGRN